MKRLLTLLLFSNLLLSLLQAQPVHQIRGTVIEKNSRQPLEFINVMVLGLNKGGVTNAEGHFTIEQVPPGIYRLQATAIGYKSVTTPEYIVSTKDLNISIEMEENLTELAGVTVTASPFRRDLESPVSLSQRSTKLNRRMSTHITDCIAKLGNLFGRWFSSAGNEGESVDVLGFIVLGLSKTFFSGKEIVNLGFSPVVGGLCTPFAVFRTSAGLGVDDGTHVELV